MTDRPSALTHPWMVAVWPGMGGVAINACVYLLAKLKMGMIGEISADELFDIRHVEVRQGVLRLARRPRHRLFAWRDPNGHHDIVVFLGEAQPETGTTTFARHLVEYARTLGVEKIFTFAAMATDMHPSHASRVFVSATDEENLDQIRHLNLKTLEDGHIGGLNGVLLGVAAEEGLHGACFLGEIPAAFSQVAYPKASLAVLEAFIAMTGMEVDLDELREKAAAVDEQLSDILSQVEESSSFGEPEAPGEFAPEPDEEDRLSPAHRQRIEELFALAQGDRSKAFELKQELDRFGVFKEYEDRFLDLFKSPEK